MPERRTMIVLGALLAGMTVVSGLLRALEPGPVAPGSFVTLRSIETGVSPEARLFNTAEAQNWKAIVIHDSGRLTGSAQTLNHRDQQRGREGLGYHFVVNNDRGEKPDGVIEVGYRWQQQQDGAYLRDTSESQWFHDNAIGVCLVGDADREPFTSTQRRELLWLIQKLQKRFDIPANRVYIQVGSDDRAQLVPSGRFRDQLLTHRTP